MRGELLTTCVRECVCVCVCVCLCVRAYSFLGTLPAFVLFTSGCGGLSMVDFVMCADGFELRMLYLIYLL